MIDSLSPEQRQAILDAIYGRQKIVAIKLVREATGGELKDAKEFVERFSAELEAREPHKFKSRGKGCMVMLAMGMLSLGGILVIRFFGKS